jgi:hypothetical protein
VLLSLFRVLLLLLLNIFSILFATELLRLYDAVLDFSLNVVDFGSMCEMSDVEFENMAILSFTLFSDFSSLLRQLKFERWRPSVADLNGGFVSTKFVISSKW